MIKDLINDLSKGTITLTHALNRSKVLAHNIDNSAFKHWIKEQLDGFDDIPLESLPTMRSLKCKTFLTHVLPNGTKHNKEVIGGEEYEEYLNRYGYCGSIPLLEQQLNTIEGGTLMAPLDAIQYQTLAQADKFGKWVTGGYRQFDRGQLIDIVEKTKQRLLDTLLDLDTQFPDLEKDFMKTEKNEEKIKNIVTNNIYGSSSGLVLSTGSTITQSHITNSNSTINTWQELEKLGVGVLEVSQLREIVENNTSNKPTFTDKAMKWFGNVSASLATKGLADNIPKIYEYVTQLLQN